ncbi:MAG: hypothetical protein KC535_05085, partial [Nanoarchaeota archaeon]|nr:hypothetical protein [Nanoarchaeota archaeon]
MLKFQQNLEDQLLSRPAPRFWKSLQSILDDEGGGKLFFYSVASACVSGLAAYVFYQHQGAAAVSDSLHVLSDYVGTLADLTSPKLKEVQVTVLPQAYDHIKMGIDTLVSHLPDKAYLLSSVD